MRLDQLVAAYAMFARGGMAVAPTWFRSPAPREPRRLVSERTAFWITDILSDDDARSFVFGRGGSREFPFPVAAKTGTSQAYRDNWAIGYTRSVTVGVWVGNFDRRPLVGSSGVSGAGPIFHAIMLAAARRIGGVPGPQEPATAATPERTTKREVCALSGLAPSPWCPGRVDEWVADDLPLGSCTWHRPAEVNAALVHWPADYRAWAEGEHLADRVMPIARRRSDAAPKGPRYRLKRHRAVVPRPFQGRVSRAPEAPRLCA